LPETPATFPFIGNRERPQTATILACLIFCHALRCITPHETQADDGHVHPARLFEGVFGMIEIASLSDAP